MNPFLEHMAESAVYMAGFYLVYFIFLSLDTRYLRNRIYLLVSVTSSLLLPVVSVNIRDNSTMSYIGKVMSEIIITDNRETVRLSGELPASAGIAGLLFKIYLTGIALIGLKFIANIFALLIIIARKGNNDERIIRYKRLNSPGFSAFGYIFIRDSLTRKEEEKILLHEHIHLKHYHFLDILFIEVVKILQWFNPFIYMIDKSLRAVHEYQADEECIAAGTEVKDYWNLLMSTLLNTRTFATSNSFANPSIIRKRMLMMVRRKSAVITNIKTVLTVPVVFFLIMLISSCEKAVSTRNGTEKKTANESVTTYKTQINDVIPEEVFVIVEDMPGFPGGEKALMEFIYENIRYPEEARQAGIEGRVVIRFCVNYNGAVDRVSVIKGVHPLLDNEAIRVVSLLPPWEPGKQGGKPVNVWYSVPINFQLR